MKKKVFLAVLVCLVVMAVAAVSASADADDFIIEDGMLLGYEGDGGDIVIPSGVTSIEDFVFYNRFDITSVVIPSGVKSIGMYAFADCEGLTGITIPSSVTTIGDYAFSGCSNMSYVSLSSGLQTIGSGAFSGCESLTEIVIPSGVISIGDYAFANLSNLKSMTIPSSVSYIGYAAICRGTVVDTPSGSYAYNYCIDNGVPLKDAPVIEKPVILEAYVNDWNISGSTGDNRVGSGVPVDIYIATYKNSQSVTMCDSTGKEIKTWNSGYTDSQKKDWRSWKFSYTFTGSGSKNVYFRTTNGKTVSDIISITIEIVPPSDPKVTLVMFDGEATVGEPVHVFVQTSTAAKYVQMCDSTGNSIYKTWTTGYTDEGNLRVWDLEYTFVSAGTRTMYFRTSADGIHYSSVDCSDIFERDCLRDTVVVNPARPAINSVKFNSSATVGSPVGITVTTPTTTKYISMCNANGSAVYKTWTSGYTDSGSTRTWKVNYSFATAGNRVMYFRASADNKTFSALKSATCVVNPAAPVINSVKFNSNTTVGKAVGITATTSTNVTGLSMCASNGTTVYKTWTSGYSDSNGVRTWKVNYTFAGAGTRTMYFKASNGKTASALKSATCVVSQAAPVINSVKFNSNTTVGKAIGITATTSTTATSLSMCASNGTTVYKTWTSGYSDSNGVRTWNVNYTFAGAGTRTMYFKVSDGKTESALKSATCVVSPAAPVINSVKFNSNATVGKAVGITATTSTTATSLSMCASNGTTVYKTWTSGYSDSNGVRTWKVEYSFAGAGTRTMYFKASNGTNTSALVSASVVVSKAAAEAKVTSASFNSDAIVGKAVNITVKTTTAAKYVRMCAENGGTVKTWSSGYTDNGDVRTWNLSYSFSGAGYRSITFKASADNSKYDTGVVAKVAVNPAVPTVSYAAFNVSSAKVNTSVGITVKTSSNATTLALCAENGGVVKTWSASGNSTVSGNVRTWNVSYSFGGAGNRSIGFKAASSAGYGSAVTAKITIKK